ncbi:hypothetical protein AX660_11565 [Paraglaciecola hydrolytica]|uniref:Carbohydrate kinase PfkB domain-containing protein n=2 Tax=Paraglaciecola hydrolytica TaxID=1799789 RepID=A0A136A0T2_9ALTE|nr:hypothetical protein AX660_11565 [Paraglaciecola hydrolytica]
MLELRQGADGKSSAGRLNSGFAGDTLNAAIYAKRVNPELEVSFLSGIGKDPYSQGFVEFCQQEFLNTELLLRSKTANLGIYAIDVDDKGERSFYYWRKDSAATQVIQLVNEYWINHELHAPTMVFFSGLSLGILSDDDKQSLLNLIQYFKTQGSQVAFDPNYRARMWSSKAHTVTWLTKAYVLSDVILPGLDEHQALFGHNSAQDVADYMQSLGNKELIVKCGLDGVLAFEPYGQVHHQAFNPAPVQVDSTAAGDSFAGTYLATRLANHSVAQAIKQADSVARFVVQHPGAIVETSIFNAFLAKEMG